jgi:hypothetical protein
VHRVLRIGVGLVVCVCVCVKEGCGLEGIVHVSVDLSVMVLGFIVPVDFGEARIEPRTVIDLRTSF